jgi:hypothetical protein
MKFTSYLAKIWSAMGASLSMWMLSENCWSDITRSAFEALAYIMFWSASMYWHRCSEQTTRTTADTCHHSLWQLDNIRLKMGEEIMQKVL